MRRFILAAAVLLIIGVAGGCAPAYQGSFATAETYVAAEVIESTVYEETTLSPQIQEKQTQTGTSVSTNGITADSAKAIAVKDAGLKAENISYSSAKLDKEDERQTYEVKLFADGTEYEYEILASDGTILKKQQAKEWTQDTLSLTESTTVSDQLAISAPQTQLSLLTPDQAKQKVAERIQGVDINSIYIIQEHDDGRLVYEGEVYFNQKKYEFTLDAATGNFAEWEEE